MGIRQGELGALRWLDCEFENMNFSVQHSYCWRRSGHLKSTKTEASVNLLPMHPSSLRETEGQQTTRLGFGVEEKDSTGVQEDRHHGSGLAHISAHGGNHAGRDGRTPTHDPGLLTSREFACNQQVSSGNDNEQAFGTRKAGGRHSARGRAIGKQINPGPLGFPGGNLIGPKWTQIVFGGSA